MIQNITKVLGILGGGAVLFYALGFIVVKMYIYKIGLEGMFWFTREFYIDAGACFLLEMVSAPLLTPHLFIIYLVLLFLLLPKEKNLLLFKPKDQMDHSKGEPAFRRKQWIKISVLLFIMLITSFSALNYDYLTDKRFFLGLVNHLVFDPAQEAFTPVKKSRAFFSFVTPMLIVFGVFLYRFFSCFKEGTQSRIFYQFCFMVYLIFFTIVPISYGFYLYDWKLVPIKDPHVIEKILYQGEEGEPKQPADTYLRVWLLGQFGDKYLFLTKKGVNEEGIIEVVKEKSISRLNFNPSRADSLRYEIGSASEANTIQFMEKTENLVQFLELE